MTKHNLDGQVWWNTEAEAMEAATKALVLEIQNVETDWEDRALLETECEPYAEQDYDETDTLRWYARIYDGGFGGSAVVHCNLNIEWIG
jgi:hypothetical protein